jgi:hypothetical protein
VLEVSELPVLLLIEPCPCPLSVWLAAGALLSCVVVEGVVVLFVVEPLWLDCDWATAKPAPSSTTDAAYRNCFISGSPVVLIRLCGGD